MIHAESTRRGFLRSLSAAALAENVVAGTSSADATGMPTRVLGRTGVRVSILGIGGAHAGRAKEENDCIRLIQTALDEGINFMDNAWEYGRGRCEDVMGKALAMDGRRKKAFLMTKVCSREYEGAKQQIDESLKRLQTDYLDLLQFHECNCYNDPEWVFEKGAVRAVEEAKKQGKVRFIGFTGHKAPAIHLDMLGRNFTWDTSQMPNNIMDARFESFRQRVMPVCLKKNVGIIGMKGIGGDGKMVNAGLVTLEECYRYCLSQPVAVQVVGLTDLEMLKTALKLGREFKPLSETESAALQAKVKDVQGDGRYELFKSSKRYDSAYHRQQHGFDLQGN
ncbi:MAG: aldo/keto reductase [Acidobacteria bacterium]|nr:aldo/keto reductase [Acidobacteriota bacterium]